MPSGPVSLVVTDLDGTFWHTDEQIDPAVVDAARALADRRVPLLVATGRRLTSTRRPLAEVGLTPPAVVLNGALGVDLADGAGFHQAPYPPAQAAAVLAAFRGVGMDPVVYVDDPDRDAVVSATPSTHPSHARAIGGPPADLDRVISEQAVLGFSMIGVDHTACAAAREAIGDRAETHLDRSLDFPGRSALTVAPFGQSKWDGVLAFCAAQRIDPDRVLAVGDGPNDIELLEQAAVALVPEAAYQVALDCADHVIGAAADGGWVAVLDHLG